MPLTILAVDDEIIILQSLSGILSDEGFKTLTASNGYEALKIIEEESPDLVLLDIWMPGIDGIETLQEIKRTHPLLPVVVLSGHGTIETAVRATKLGAYDFIEKPISIERVVVTINNALNVKKQDEEGSYLQKLQKIGIKNLKEKPRVGHFMAGAAKKLRLDNINIDVEGVHELYSILGQIFSMTRHNLRNNVTSFSMNSIRISRALKHLRTEVTKNQNSKSVTKSFDNMEKAVKGLIRANNRLETHLNILFGGAVKEGFHNQLVSKPSIIVEFLSQSYQNTIIEVSKKSLKSLEILFPEGILYGILDELVYNVQAENLNPPKIFMSWKVTDNRFICEVHDNGRGITKSLNFKPKFLESLPINASGLAIIDNALRRAGGYMTFTRSRHLKGTLVHMEFPVKAYYKKGGTHEFTRHRQH